MTIKPILIYLVVGSVAGWLAGKIIKGDGFGLIGNMFVGVVGALIGGIAFDFLEISAGGMFGFLITAIAGSIILLFFINLIK